MDNFQIYFCAANYKFENPVLNFLLNNNKIKNKIINKKLNYLIKYIKILVPGYIKKNTPHTKCVLNYLHLKRVMANLQHMCLCECDHPLQIKTITYIIVSYYPDKQREFFIIYNTCSNI